MYDANGSSDAISRDMNSLLYSSTFKHPADGEFAKIKQLISLDPYPNFNQNQNQPQNHENQAQNHQDELRNENRSSLLRYRSTPSSFFSNLLTDNGNDEFSDPVTAVTDVTDSSKYEPEERFFMRNQHQHQQHQQQQQKESESDVREFLQYTPDLKQERKETAVQKQDLAPPSTAAMNGVRRVPNLPPLNGAGGYGYANQSNLVRQNSTPAGFLSALTVDNGFAGMKKGASSSTSNNHISFSLGPSSSSSRFLPQIAENENELQESPFGSMKRSRDGGLKMPQNGETGNNAPSLVHHMSLPKTSSEMANVENFFHFQQESTVPWKTRAKRGFATHPRSIAERERRTRISERIKRLQELFPDIDKQTNTADMLDMAVEYIKNLQNELQSLNDARARCRCSREQLQSGSNT
ncbi:putative transcription factor bHLH family [Helianthus annuus]|uniref:Putative myc-type, basic helix-loop-helix (BHLH) domain-containing protein n=1 Tax=Helianthus annuus TaxID=4232 RepID=A0A251S0L1_HELAN|nr:transcription factor bHLH130 [Helianthus annuus]XP_035841240.1 transcription factor bHLH130 [Helianthus annuus]KAF5760958.1 putative transcription factor bHLH family [Helianthus annuus]KAJ0438894.1 putative transcription factor bHLH family [Helianthus annuus]KAJ0443827.1 putative transcription factor bHLH family [Helianthus annuus]KAJ0461247.1 putative transcription factor bHLH family [Helianthus annuus]KAJ0641673.1 putative transcription factor bHLH family [Helianthus annuus]